MASEQTAEVIDFRERLSKRNTLYLGHLALGHEQLGINDPKTYLHMYLEHEEEAMTAIKEDLAGDIAERLPDDPFINKVQFEFTGSDFLSVKDQVSMKRMTAVNEQIVREEAVKNGELSEELTRSSLEAAEPYVIEEWFWQAPIGSYLIFEALPIGEQEFAIPRIFKKTSDHVLEGYFLSLHNPSVSAFNELRQQMGVDARPGRDPLEILANYYHQPPDETFVDRYIQTYDELLQAKDPLHREHAYGLPDKNRDEIRNGVELARNPELSAIYEDMLKALAGSKGIATPAIMDIIQSLKLKIDIKPEERLTLDKVGDLMEKVIVSIASVIDQASPEILEGLNQPGTYSGTAYSAAAHYGRQAEASGQAYGSGGCPSIARGETQAGQAKGAEAAASVQAYTAKGRRLDSFGRPKMGVCRTSNCTSRGESIFWPSKTLVGGCDLCVDCHIYFKNKKNPKLEHKKNRAEIKARHEAAKQQRQAREKQHRQKLAA